MFYWRKIGSKLMGVLGALLAFEVLGGMVVVFVIQLHGCKNENRISGDVECTENIT